MINLTLGDSMILSRGFERHYEQMKGRTPITGARVVAKAWVDPDFKALLKISPKEAILGWDPSVKIQRNFVTYVFVLYVHVIPENILGNHHYGI
jgi:hypothetical protein